MLDIGRRWLRHVLAGAAFVVVSDGAFARAQTTTTPAGSSVSTYGIVSGDSSGSQGVSAIQTAMPSAVDNRPHAKRGELVIAPMPMVNPTLENGVSLVAGYLYRLDVRDQEMPPSATGIAGFKTSNGSWAGAVLQSLHLAHDRVRLLAVGAYGDVNYEFFGIGQSAGNAGQSIQLNQTGPVALFDGLLGVHPRWYLGARYQILRMKVDTAAVTVPGGPTLPALDANLRTASLGPRVEYDSRDSTFYPRSGMQIQGIVNLYGKGVGGDRNYQVYEGWLNRYHAVNARNVVAWHIGACGAGGSVAFYDLCMLGKNQDLRGYPVGQYRDRLMLAAQAEWRSEIWWRFGAVLFAGAGEVAPEWSALTSDGVLPGGGAGLRFTLAKRNHVNLRVDYAWGKASRALYVGVAEAF